MVRPATPTPSRRRRLLIGVSVVLLCIGTLYAGTVEVGKRADLLIVKDDPLRDLAAALRTILWTVRDGTAHTPEEWMQLR